MILEGNIKKYINTFGFFCLNYFLFFIHSPRDYILRPQKQTCVPIDLQLRFPEGSYGRIASLSIILSQFKIGVIGSYKYIIILCRFINIIFIEGVIDRDFMGNVCVCLINYSKKKYTIKRGDRIAQLICEKYTSPQTIEMLSFTAKTSHIERSSVVLDTPPPTTDVLQSTKM